MRRPSSTHLVLAALALVLLASACGTGIEVREHVTDKDVRRVLEQVDAHEPVVTLEAYVDSFAAWKEGKRFWVADDKVAQMLAVSTVYDKDTLHLAGHTLVYDGWTKSGIVTDEDYRRLYIDFIDEQTGMRLVYRYGRARDAYRAGFSLPMLIDMDMVAHVARQ